ncbi:MAG TPA: hypothetical protein VII49_12970 [Rhizomicrobium sp.]
MRKLWALLGLFVAVLLVFVGIATFSPSYQTCKAHGAEYAAAEYQGNAGKLTHKPITDNTFIDCESFFADENGAGVTALGTVLLFVVTGLLTWVAYDQGQTSRAQLRAYLFVETADIEWETPESIPSANVKLKNFGQTPAKSVCHWMHVIYGPNPRTNPFPDIDTSVKRPRAFPPGAVSRTYPRLTRALAPEEIQALANGDAAIYIRGKIEYVDVFGKDRWTVFCLFTGGALGLTKQVAQHSDGNDFI